MQFAIAWLLIAYLALVQGQQSVPGISRIESARKTLFIDEWGRTRIFRGTNVVAKTPPYVPDTSFSAAPHFSFNQKDVDLLAQHGTTVIRLGVMWAGVEPVRGQVNQTYLVEVGKIVQMCSDAGIYVLLDFHQDLLSEKFCGEGVPLWLFNPPSSGADAFPVPLNNNASYSADANGIPSYNDCTLQPNFSRYVLADQVGKSYQALYSNTNNVRDAFINYWTVVAKFFLPYKNILGYDLMNEPWVGDIRTDAKLLLNPVYADEHSLQPFYDIIATAIRGVDPSALIHFESSSIVQDQAGFTAVPGGATFSNTSVYNFHYYADQVGGQGLEQVLQSRIGTATVLGCGAILSEYEAGSGPGAANVVNVSRSADEVFLSAIGWEFKEYDTVPIITGLNHALLDPFTGVIRQDFATAFSRPYAHAIAGVPVSMHFDDAISVFVVTYNFNGAVGPGALTEVRTNFASHYPGGWKVLVVATSGAFEVLADHGVSNNAIYVVPSVGNAPTAGAGVALAVYPQNVTMATLTAPPAISNATPVSTKKSSSWTLGRSFIIMRVCVLALFLGLG